MKTTICIAVAVLTTISVSYAVTLTQPIDMNNNNILNVSNLVSVGGTQSGSGKNAVALGYNGGLRENNGDGSVNIGYNLGRNRAEQGSVNIGFNNGGVNIADWGGNINMGYLAGAGCTNYANIGCVNMGYNGGRNYANANGCLNIGYNTGYNTADGNGAINMGYNTGRSSADSLGSMNIGRNSGGTRWASGTGSLTAGSTYSGHANIASGDGSWAVGCDVTSSYNYAYVFGRYLGARRDNSLSCMHLDVNGTPYANQSSFTLYSDARLKNNVATIGNALDTMLKLRGVTFTYKPTKGLPQGERMGFIAQETEKVMPSWVQEMGDGYKGMAPEGFEALSVEATRELKATLDAQQKEIEQLRREIAEMKKMLAN